MGSIEFDRVSFAYASGRVLLSEVSFRLEAGVTALVGENGAGKSTLLRLVARVVAPESGSVRVPSTLRIAACDERLEQPSDDVRALAERTDVDAHRLRVRLGIAGLVRAPWHTLSPGERRRHQLAAALAVEPDVLLLDEPSNHIDVEARTLLIDVLRRFRGDTLLISHDRALIDAVAARTLHLQGGKLRLFHGGYSEASAALAREREARLHDKARRRRDAQRDRQVLDEARRAHAAADHARSARTRSKGPRDHDARSMGRIVAVGWAEARRGRSVAVQRKNCERSEAHAAELHVEKPLGRKLFAAYVPCPRGLVGTLQVERLGYAEHVVLRDVNLSLARDARVQIEGNNGAGKTTLLRALHAALREPEAVLYLPQELTPGHARERCAALYALERGPRSRVLEVLAALGVDPARVLASDRLSAGETRKLWLAFGLGRGAHALLLDEPTNDLDLPSIERLERALAEYPGALVMITHDAHFARATLREAWMIADGQVRVASR